LGAGVGEQHSITFDSLLLNPAKVSFAELIGAAIEAAAQKLLLVHE